MCLSAAMFHKCFDLADVLSLGFSYEPLAIYIALAI
jgi:hypothetical protein